MESSVALSSQIPIVSDGLHIAEQFYSIQGENFVGNPAIFLRLQFCTLHCRWCDTLAVWKKGRKWNYNEILEFWSAQGWINKLAGGARIVLTGGSPVRQQEGFVKLMELFRKRYLFMPFVEVENECTLMPNNSFIKNIKCWNNSPKLSNSGMVKSARYKPNIIKKLSSLSNSWFKFVVDQEIDMLEIEEDFLVPKLINRKQVVLMPQGITREEVLEQSKWVIEICKEQNFKFSPREHIMVWNETTGV